MVGPFHRLIAVVGIVLRPPREFDRRLTKCASFFLTNFSLAFSRHISDADVQDRVGKKYMHESSAIMSNVRSLSRPGQFAPLRARGSMPVVIFSVHSLHRRGSDA